MLDEIVKQLKIINDNKISELAAMNLLQAKLCHVFSFRNIKFLSVNNTDETCMAYYAFNFIASGGRKDKLIKDINKKLLPFFSSYLDSFNEQRRKAIETKYQNKKDEIAGNLNHKESELTMTKKEEQEVLKNFRKLEKEISNATLSSLYQSTEIIDECGSGSLLFEESEFVNFYKDIVINKDKTKSDFFSTIFKFYDGDFTPTNTTTVQREQKNNIPLSCAFLSSPKMLINNDKLTTEFKELLEQGIARRCFIYYKKDENYYLDEDIYYPTYEEIQEAVKKLESYSLKLSKIFTDIPIKTVYTFSPLANNRIRKWKSELDKRIKEFYKFTKNLSTDMEILKLDLEHSTWKIIKLAVLYHILSDHKEDQIQPESFEKACDFFEKTHKCLEDLLTTKVSSDYEKLYNFLIENRNQFHTKMNLRKEKFVDPRGFANWFDGAITEVETMCEKSNLCFVTNVTGKRNQGFEIAIYDPSEYKYVGIRQNDKGDFIEGRLVSLDKLVIQEVGEEALCD